MDDLRVESYDAEKVVAQKQSILKRATMAGGAVVLTLGLFSLSGCVDDRERGEEQTTHIEEREEQFPYVVGGSGSWFISILERA